MSDIAPLLIILFLVFSLTENLYHLYFLSCMDTLSMRPSLIVLIQVLFTTIQTVFLFSPHFFSLSIFYALLFIGQFLQSMVCRLSRATPFETFIVRFVQMIALHLCLVSVFALITDRSLDEILSMQSTRVISICIALAVGLVLKIIDRFFLPQFRSILEHGQIKDFRFFKHFTILSVIYLFAQSVLCDIDPSHGAIPTFLLGSNLLLLFLLIGYLVNIYHISLTSDAEHSNNELSRSIAQADSRLRTLQRSAYHDDLTGAFSRAYAFQHIASLLDRNALFAVVYFDLDRLKYINDTRGHQQGDSYLCRFVQELNQHIRPSDVLARIGGDEFLLILPGCDRQMADQRMDAVAQETGHRTGEQAPSFSFGASDSNEAHDLHALLECADQRMYARKKERKEAESCTTK